MASGGTSDGSGDSMASAREDEQLALMDKESSSLELIPAVPSGRPTVHAPQRKREESRKKDGKGQGTAPSVEVNSFWSQTLKDEVMLRAMRPASLPSAPMASTAAEPSMVEDTGMDMREVIKMIMSQNSMLKRELADLKKQIEDSNKEKDRDFKEVDRPKPPSTTPPPSPPSGPPPATPEAGKYGCLGSDARVPRPGAERRGEPEAPQGLDLDVEDYQTAL